MDQMTQQAITANALSILTSNIMDIRAALLKEHSKEQTLKIVHYIGENKARFALLMDLFLNDEYRVTQRAAWVVGHTAEKNPQLFQPYLQVLIENLQKSVHDAIKRNTLRVLQDIDIPEDLLGLAAEICFSFLDDPKEPVAVRVFSMTVCYNICVKEPDLSNELKLIIEDHLPHGSAGFKSRGKRTLKLLDKLMR